MLELPSSYKTAKTNLWDFTYLWAGVKKAGKTTFLAEWQDHFILEGEPGNAKHLNANYVDIHNWSEVVGYLDLLERTPNYCKIVFVDGIDKIYAMLVKSVRLELKLPDLKPLEFGAWNAIRMRFENFIQRLHNLNIGVGYTTHTELVTATDLVGREISKLETSMSKQCNEIMDGIIHFWGVMLLDEKGNRIMRLQGDSFIKAGNSLSETHFRWKGRSIKQIPMGKSGKEAFFYFMCAFDNNLEVPESYLQ